MIKIYSKNSCVFCVRAKNYLESKNIKYEEVNIEHDSEAREWILEQGHRTVPQVYINDELVEGGFNGLVETPDTLLLG